MFITDVSLKRPSLSIVVIIAMLAVGIVSFMRLNLNEMPETNIPWAVVTIELPGASPDQVKTKVTKEVEDAVGQIAGAKHITSNVSAGSSMTMIEFDNSVNSAAVVQEVKSKIAGIRDLLPREISEPVIQNFNFNDLPILSLAVSGDLGSAELSTIVRKTIIPELNTISGVGSVKASGLMNRQIQIKVNKEKLSSLNLTIDQVVTGLQSDNIDNPSGKVSDGSREVTIRTYSSIKSIEDFKKVIIATVNGTEIRLGDIAETVDGFKENTNKAFYNGKECIGIDILKQSGTNTVKVADGVRNKISILQETLPEGVKIDIVTDGSETIRASVKGVEQTMVEGCILAVVIIFLFLRTLGSTVVSAISLPTSIIATFAAMKIMNFTLNTMSLMALSLSVGLLVDDSIVVIENIVRHLRMGKKPVQAAKEATSEISLAVLATTLTIVAVFLPISVMKGEIGSFFREFGLTIAFAVMISLFVSFTLVPLMSSRYVHDEENIEPRTKIGVFLKWFNHQFERLAVLCRIVLDKVLEHRKKTILIATVMFALSLALIPLMGISFSPPKDMGRIGITATLDSGLSLKSAEKKAIEIEKIVKKYPDVTSVYTTFGKESVNISLTLTDKRDRKLSSNAIAAQMRSELKKIPGLDLSVTGTQGFGGGGGKSYALHIQGNDFNQVLEYSQKAKRLLSEIPGAADVGISYKAGKQETRIEVDRDAAADLGVAPSSVSNTLSTLFNGSTVGQFESNGDRISVNVGIADIQSRDLESLNGIFLLSTTTGKMVPIDQLTKKVYSTASSQIDRYDKKEDVQVQANFEGKKASDISGKFMERLSAELPPPKGITIGMGGEEQSTQDSIPGMIQAIVLGILFIFLILVAQFESWIDPFAIMFSLPLAIIGAMIALFVSGSGLSMVGLIGVIFLMGLVTKNAILLVDFIKKKREEGMERKEAILAAAQIRLRPIMMTTLAMILGMIPSALDTGVGSELRQPMAIAIIGGLVSSTLLTLLVVPVIYTFLDDVKNKFKRPSKLIAKISDIMTKKAGGRYKNA